MIKSIHPDGIGTLVLVGETDLFDVGYAFDTDPDAIMVAEYVGANRTGMRPVWDLWWRLTDGEIERCPEQLYGSATEIGWITRQC